MNDSVADCRGDSAGARVSVKRPLGNAARLGAGRGGRGLLMLAATAVAARALGVDGFGHLVLLHGAMIGFGDVVKCQSWEALLRFGARAVETGDRPAWFGILRFTLALDVVSAVLTVGLLMAVIEPASRILGFSTIDTDAARLYVVCLGCVMLTSTPMGVLRLFDNFTAIAWHTLLSPAVRAVGGLALLLAGAGLEAFMALWFVAVATSWCVLSVLAARELERAGMLPAWRELSRIPRPPPGALRFALATNALSTLKLAPQHIALLSVGWLLTPAAAALYHVARQCSDILVKPQEKLLLPAIYPEFVRIVSTRESARRGLARRLAVYSGGLAVGLLAVLVVVGEWVLVTLFGAQYGAAYWPMLIIGLGGLITALSLPLEPYFLTGAGVRRMVIVRTLALIVMVLASLVLASAWALNGIAAAVLAHATFTSLGFLALWRAGAGDGGLPAGAINSPGADGVSPLRR